MMAKWGFPDASAEVERLRVENERLRAFIEKSTDRLLGLEPILLEGKRFQELLLSRAEQAEARADRLQAERDDLAARLQSIQQAERKYTAAKLHEAAKMRKGKAL